MKTGVRIAHVAVVMGLLALAGLKAQALERNEWCAERLIVELTPDVPRPRDEGFLSSLLGNHPEYRLTLVREDDSTTIVVDLVGPGPDNLCQTVVETMRRDGRVVKIVPDPAQPATLPSVSVTAGPDEPEPKEKVPDTRVSRAGVGALFWTAAHPSQAWRLLMPVQPDDPSGVYEDLKVACLDRMTRLDEHITCP
jgi:hypothetical protein